MSSHLVISNKYLYAISYGLLLVDNHGKPSIIVCMHFLGIWL